MLFKGYFVLVFIFVFQFCDAQTKHKITNARELDVTDKINVLIIPSDKNELVIQGNLSNEVQFVQQGDLLRLKMNTGKIMQGSGVDITLYSNDVKSIIARKGSSVNSSTHTLTVDSIYLSANEGAVIELNLKTEKAKILATTGGSVKLYGHAYTQNIEVSLGGSFLGNKLSADAATVRISGGGKADVLVHKNVDVQTRAGGVANIYGKPVERKEKKVLGGKINYL